MTFKYGFELEGFCVTETGIQLPDKKLPLDGFPGLVELRTSGGSSLNDAYAEIMRQMVFYDLRNINFHMSSGKFSPEQKRLMRKDGWRKEALEVHNLYGKKPRDLKGGTIASFQINISQLTVSERTETVTIGNERREVRIPAQHGLLDVPNIVKNLDKVFETAIRASGRQPGEYSIKDVHRLEYRSAPNSVFQTEPILARNLLKKIRIAVEGK